MKLFESGDIFEMMGERVEEKRSLAFVATGAVGGGLHGKPDAYTFYDMKGDLEALLSQFEHRTLYFDQHAPAYLHPGRSARAVMDGAMVARFGQLHPELATARKLRQPVYVAEILLDRLFQRELRQPNYRPVPRFPAVERDFSLLFDAAVVFERIQQAVEALGIPELRELRPVEILRGGQGSAGRGRGRDAQPAPEQVRAFCCGRAFSRPSVRCVTMRLPAGRSRSSARWRRSAGSCGDKRVILSKPPVPW